MYLEVRRNKYNAQKTVFGNRKYDSKHEAGVAQDIDLLRKSGEVVEVYPQKTFALYGKNGSKVGQWRADFLLTFKDGHQEVIEAKGLESHAFRFQRNLFVDNYPDILLTIVKGKQWTPYRH